jgi:hypothetical protein
MQPMQSDQANHLEKELRRRTGLLGDIALFKSRLGKLGWEIMVDSWTFPTGSACYRVGTFLKERRRRAAGGTSGIAGLGGMSGGDRAGIMVNPGGDDRFRRKPIARSILIFRVSSAKIVWHK